MRGGFLLLLGCILANCSTPPPTRTAEEPKKEEVKVEPEKKPQRRTGAAPAAVDQNEAEPAPEEHKKEKAKGEEILTKRILVLTFTNKTPYGGRELAEYAASSIRSEITKVSDEYVIVNEEDIEGAEDFISLNGTYNYRRIFERARAHGVSAIVTGAIEDLSIQDRGDEVGIFQTRYHTANAQVRLNLFDAGTEKTLMSKVANAEVTEEHTRFFKTERSPDSVDSDRSQGAVSKALEKLYSGFLQHAKKIAWVGRIAKIDLHRYYINAGEASGISRGQLLKVFGEGEAVTDQSSKRFLGMAPGRFKGILKVVDYFGLDGAIAVIHSGAGFRETDRVEIYSPPH